MTENKEIIKSGRRIYHTSDTRGDIRDCSGATHRTGIKRRDFYDAMTAWIGSVNKLVEEITGQDFYYIHARKKNRQNEAALYLAPRIQYALFG